MDNVDYKIITGIRYDNLSDNLNILNRNSIEPISNLDNDIARKLEMDNTQIRPIQNLILMKNLKMVGLFMLMKVLQLIILKKTINWDFCIIL